MIITNNETALRIKCEDVSENEVGTLIENLENELTNANRLGKGGIGLAAPQIGIAKSIAIVRLGNISINLVNCKIEKGYDKIHFAQEGCLSFPKRLVNTLRYQEVYVTNNLVFPHSFIATGLIAVICQHEIDHLNETLFMDKEDKIIKLKIGPNDLCFCGSNIKYKRCCGNK